MTKLWRTSGSVLLALTLFAAMRTAASAQTFTPNVQDPYSIKLGMFFPSNGDARSAGGSTQFSAGLDYALAKTTSDTPALPSVYFDYEGGASNGHIDSFGLGAAIRTLTTSADNRFTPYVGAGAGVYYEDGNHNGNSDTNVGIGAKVFVGENIGQGLFVEGNYQFLPSTAGINPSGFGVQLGYRF